MASKSKKSTTSPGTFRQLSNELPMSKEPDLVASLNAPLKSQEKFLNHTPEFQYFSRTAGEEYKTSESREIRKEMEKNELARLKNVVERWEAEIQHTFNLYQESLFRNLLGESKQRIRQLEAIELSGSNHSLLQELRSRVEELNQRGGKVKALLRSNYLGVEKEFNSSLNRIDVPSINTARATRTMENIRQAVKHPMDTFQEKIGSKRVQFYQEKFGNFLAFFMVLFFGNLSFKGKGLHLWGGAKSLGIQTMNRWRRQIKQQDRLEQHKKERYEELRSRMGFLGLIFTYSLWMMVLPLKMMNFFLFFGWKDYSVNIAKRIIVRAYDYFSPIYQSTESIDEKIEHMISDAKMNLVDTSEKLKSSITKKAHTVMSPVEYATENYIKNEELKGHLKKALGAVDKLYDASTPQSSEEVTLVHKKRASVSSSPNTTSPAVASR